MYYLRGVYSSKWWLIHAEWWLFPTSANQCGQNTAYVTGSGKTGNFIIQFTKQCPFIKHSLFTHLV